MYQVLFKIDGEWMHMVKEYHTEDSALLEAYAIANGFYTARLLEAVEVVKMVLENGSIVSRELIRSITRGEK